MKIRNFDTVLRSFPRKGDPLDFEGTWREEAVRAHLIPIYSSFDTYYALTDDGNIVYCFGSWEEAQTITNTRYRHMPLRKRPPSIRSSVRFDRCGKRMIQHVAHAAALASYESAIRPTTNLSVSAVASAGIPRTACWTRSRRSTAKTREAQRLGHTLRSCPARGLLP